MKKHIPNMITLLNLLSGSVAVIYAVQGEFFAVWMLCILAAVFDFLDGFAARALGAYSDIGKELDSLCDCVSFGLAPSIAFITFYNSVCGGSSFLGYIPLAIAACSALRLAKFNLDSRQSKSFLGLPTPACGLLTVSLTACSPSLLSTVWFIPALSAVLSFLLVSEIPMFSMKTSSLKLKLFFAGDALIAVACFIFLRTDVIWFTLPRCLALILTYYIILNLIPVKK